jgi:hypothetical protein
MQDRNLASQKEIDKKICDKNGHMKEPPMRNKQHKPMKSKENGYTGPSELWFDEEAYNKPKSYANFD